MLTEEYENDELVRGQYYRKNQLEPVSINHKRQRYATIYDEDGVFLRKVTYMNRKIVDPNKQKIHPAQCVICTSRLWPAAAVFVFLSLGLAKKRAGTDCSRASRSRPHPSWHIE